MALSGKERQARLRAREEDDTRIVRYWPLSAVAHRVALAMGVIKEGELKFDHEKATEKLAQCFEDLLVDAYTRAKCNGVTPPNSGSWDDEHSKRGDEFA